MSLSTVVAKWVRALMAPAKDPRLSYQDALNLHQALTGRVRQARGSLGAARTRLESQLAEVKRTQPASPGDDEDPFAQQLQRLVAEGISDLEEELLQLRREDEELDLVEKRLVAEERALRARREALAAHQVASQARSRAHEQLGDLPVDSNRFGSLLEDANRRADSVEDKLAAAANLAGIMTFARTGSSEAQGLAMHFIAAARTEASLQRKGLLAAGFRCLLDLEAEHSQLQGLIQRSASDELLSSAYIQGLATETNRQGIRLLNDALALISSLHVNDEQSLGSQRSEPGDEQEKRVAGLLDQAGQCVHALRQTRLDLADATVDGSRRQAEAAIAALQRATQNAKSIEAELERLDLYSSGASPGKEIPDDD